MHKDTQLKSKGLGIKKRDTPRCPSLYIFIASKCPLLQLYLLHKVFVDSTSCLVGKYFFVL